MGIFTYHTADTGEIITEDNPNVAVLLPDGEPPITGRYNGYGEVAGADLHVVLAQMNLLKGEALDFAEMGPDEHERLRMIGITLDCGDFYECTITGKRYGFGLGDFSRAMGVDIEPFAGNYETPMGEELEGKTPNELTRTGVWVPHPCRDLVENFRPLKLARDPSLRYEDLPESRRASDNLAFLEKSSPGGQGSKRKRRPRIKGPGEF